MVSLLEEDFYRNDYPDTESEESEGMDHNFEMPTRLTCTSLLPSQRTKVTAIMNGDDIFPDLTSNLFLVALYSAILLFHTVELLDSSSDTPHCIKYPNQTNRNVSLQ